MLVATRPRGADMAVSILSAPLEGASVSSETTAPHVDTRAPKVGTPPHEAPARAFV